MGDKFATPTGMHSGKPKQITKASGAETASTTHPAVDSSASANAVVTVTVTASGGTTPTLTVVVEGSNDGTNWVALGTIGANGYVLGTPATPPTNLTGAATVVGVFPAMQQTRTRSVVGGTTPSFTYSVGIDLDA
jgi:hypothetical protein